MAADLKLALNSLLKRLYWPILAVLGVFCLGCSFVLGRQEGKQGGQKPVTLACSDTVLQKLTIPVEALADPDNHPPPAVPQTGQFAGSKNGTKYYGPMCSSLKRIKPENRVWFSDAESAKLQGYTPGKC